MRPIFGKFGPFCPLFALATPMSPIMWLPWRRNGVGRACLFVMVPWGAIARFVKIKTVGGVTCHEGEQGFLDFSSEMSARCSPS